MNIKGQSHKITEGTMLQDKGRDSAKKYVTEGTMLQDN
jgi:hypothetical protein